MSRRTGLLALTALVASMTVAPTAQAYTCGTQGDTFDRGTNTSDLGAPWVERGGNWQIRNGGGKLYQDDENAIGPLVTRSDAGKTDVDVCVDVLKYDDTQSASVGLITGSGSDGQYYRYNEATVLAVNDSASFNQVYMNAYFTIATPFKQARLHARQVGKTLTLDIDRNFDGVAEETFTQTASYTFQGTDVGLTAKHAGSMDNFRFGAVVPPSSGAPGAPATPQQEPAPVTPSTVDTIKPALGALGLARSSFAAAPSGASVSARRKRKPAPIGSKVSFSLSEPGSVRFTVQRKTTGRKIGKRCKARTRARRKKPRCTLWKAVRGSFTVQGKAGRNSFTFRGRVGRRSLRPGGYRLSGTATDGAKNTSAPRLKPFRIVRR